MRRHVRHAEQTTRQEVAEEQDRGMAEPVSTALPRSLPCARAVVAGAAR